MKKIIIIVIFNIMLLGYSCSNPLLANIGNIDDIIEEDEMNKDDLIDGKVQKYSVNDFLVLEFFLNNMVYGEKSLNQVISFYNSTNEIDNSILGENIAKIVLYTKKADDKIYNENELRIIADDLDNFIKNTDKQYLINLAKVMQGMAYAYITSESTDSEDLKKSYNLMKETDKTWIGQFLTVMTFGNTYIGMREHWAWGLFMPKDLKQIAIDMREVAIILSEYILEQYNNSGVESYKYDSYDFVNSPITGEINQQVQTIYNQLKKLEP